MANVKPAGAVADAALVEIVLGLEDELRPWGKPQVQSRQRSRVMVLVGLAAHA